MERHKKIILLSYHNFPYGGASANYLRNFSLGLAQLNNDIHVILPRANKYKDTSDIKNQKQGFIENVKYTHLGFVTQPKSVLAKVYAKFLGYLMPLLYCIRLKNKKDIDLLITYDVSVTKTLTALACSLILRKKLIIIVPDYFEKPDDLFSFKAFKWYNFYLGLRYFSKYADGIIVLTSFLRDYYLNVIEYKKDITIIPNFIDPSKFENIVVPPHKKDKITIGYIGTPTSKDGILDLLKSFSLLYKKYKHTHLLVIGDAKGEKSLLPPLKDFARELGALDGITFAGLVSSEDVPALLNSCQIFALTRPKGLSAEAGFPTKLGEYFACRKPVVMTNVGDVKLYFKNKEHMIIVEPDNIESIFEGFEFLVNNQNLFPEITEKAYSWMNNNINYKVASRNVDAFLNRFLKN
ncbi:MAG: putative glycosyl transferase [Bacteroidetes bacterium ADurb.Bin408]|nr:MAG: putative glycosyl transferase [Bacteroidetes bacterium ADurb.Bin408]